jgi:maleylacetate reductase
MSRSGTADRAREVAGRNGVDLLVSVGGGSATGLAKAVALTTGIPVVAVPTTYSGSEATDVWGLTEDGRKTTGHAGQVLPVTVIYDAQLALSLPEETVGGPRASTPSPTVWTPCGRPGLIR